MKKTLLCLICLVLTSALFANGAGEDEGYTFATNANWPPLEYVDENGDIVGFEIDLINAMSEVSGVPMDYVNTSWDTIFAGLANGQYDAIASGVTVTEERKLTIDFSTTIYKVTQSILTKKENSDLSTVESLFGKTVGVQMGTTGHFAMEEYPEIIIMAYEDIALAIQDMINGNCDAVVCDSVIASDYVLANENYKDMLTVTGTASETVEDIAIAVEKGNTELLDIINSSIETLRESGQLDELYARWNLI